MRKILNTLARLLTAVAIVLMLISSATEGLAGLWAGLCVLLAVLCGFLEDCLKRQDNQQKPITNVEATVVSYHKVRERVGRNNSVIRYYITFKTADGQVIEFNVSEIDYEDFDIGEVGPLRYRGWQFLSFGVQDKSHIKPMAPLPEEYEPRPEPPSLWQRMGAAIRGMLVKTAAEKITCDEQVKDEGILTRELDE